MNKLSGQEEMWIPMGKRNDDSKTRDLAIGIDCKYNQIAWQRGVLYICARAWECAWASKGKGGESKQGN
jgi:hypothetical protein